MSKEQDTAVCALGTTGPSDLMPQATTSTSRFTEREKWFIVGLIAFSGLFRQVFIVPCSKAPPNCFYYSPLTSNIYLPAIPDIVIAFHKSTELIFLTVRLPSICRTCLVNSCSGDSVHGAPRHLYVQTPYIYICGIA